MQTIEDIAMQTNLKPVALAASIALASAGCYHHGGANFWTAMAIVTTAIIISHPPPPPPVVAYAPPPRPGYTWQPGYWTLQDDQWLWVEGRWVAEYPGYRWDPSHWEQDPSGSWRLVPGRWLPA